MAYPIDPSKVAQPQEGTPAPGRHKDAPEPRASLCPSCRNYRPRDDWEHDRVIGQCSYPFGTPAVLAFSPWAIPLGDLRRTETCPQNQACEAPEEKKYWVISGDCLVHYNMTPRSEDNLPIL